MRQGWFSNHTAANAAITCVLICTLVAGSPGVESCGLDAAHLRSLITCVGAQLVRANDPIHPAMRVLGVHSHLSFLFSLTGMSFSSDTYATVFAILRLPPFHTPLAPCLPCSLPDALLPCSLPLFENAATCCHRLHHHFAKNNLNVTSPRASPFMFCPCRRHHHHFLLSNGRKFESTSGLGHFGTRLFIIGVIFACTLVATHCVQAIVS